MQKALLALAFGAFGFSASEYTIVGILSYAADSLHVNIAQAGHFLSAFSLGVVTGAILLLIFLRKIAPKKILLLLLALFAAGNILTALSDNYITMLITRFISGLPQGAFFAVASLAAEKLASKGKKAGAVAIMFAGMTVATLAGVPLFTFISHISTWRIPYTIIGLSGFVAFYLVYKWLPTLSKIPEIDLKSELSFLKSSNFWILILGVILGNGGIFCWLSYISPFMLKLSDVPAKYMTFVMAFTGLGMFLGNWASGKFSEVFAPSYVAAWVQGLACIVLALLYFFPYNPWVASALGFLCAGLMFALTVPEQMLVISTAPTAALLASALAQAGFYMGNTIGAYGGGLPIQAGLGYRATALTGLVLSAAGLIFLIIYAKRTKQQAVLQTNK